MNNKPVIVFMLGLLPVVCSFGGEKPGLTVRGSLQSDAAGWYRYDTPTESAFSFAGATMLTLDILTPPSKTAKVEALADLYQLYGGYAASAAASPQAAASMIVPGKAPLLLDLRMLYGALYLPWADVTLGRQIVNYGKGTLFSPLDAFTTVNLFELSFKRSGSDIAMVSVPLGDMAGIDAVTGFPIGNNDYASAGRAFGTVAGWDVSVAGIYRHRSRQGIAGIAFKGDLIAGVTGEAVVRYDRAAHRMSAEAMAGVDYSVNTAWLFGAEYYFRQRGVSNIASDKHNVSVTTRYLINDLMSIALTAIGALPSQKGIVMLQYSWNMMQNVNTIWYGRVYRIEDPNSTTLPDGEAGVRIVISF
jgi:hypothetical protein